MRILLYLLTCSLAGCAITPGSGDSYNLYLVRHAEKQADGSRDPSLTEVGKQRAQQLANWFQDKDIRDIWSSDYIRTRNTAGPSLSRLGLSGLGFSGPGHELRIYDPDELVSLSVTLLQIQHNAIIVGHSNTTPELARLLCQCVIDDMDDSEYDRLIVISVVGGETQVKTLRQDPLSQP